METIEHKRINHSIKKPLKVMQKLVVTDTKPTFHPAPESYKVTE